MVIIIWYSNLSPSNIAITQISCSGNSYFLIFQPLVDYLKIDIEGFENKAIKAMFLDEMLRNVKHIGLEVKNGYFLHYQLNKMSFTVKKMKVTEDYSLQALLDFIFEYFMSIGKIFITGVFQICSGWAGQQTPIFLPIFWGLVEALNRNDWNIYLICSDWYLSDT